MPNYTETLNLKLTDMDTDGDDLFLFDNDLNENFEKIDSVITELLNHANAEGIPPSICTNLRKSQNGTTVSLKWNDPADTIIDGQVLCSWGKTVIVRKLGSYPESDTDGDIIATSTIRNAYSNVALIDELPDSENEYFYKAFPVSLNGVACRDPQNCFGRVVYEFVIDPNDSNPDTCVKYTGANADFEPVNMDFDNDFFNYGDWAKAFFMGLFRPCMLNPDGTVKYYLNPNDYAFQEDGLTPSEVADTTQTANAMVEVGQIWLKEEEDANGLIHVYISNEQAEGFDCYTHLRKDGTYNEYYYRAIYDGSNISNTIRSLSGQAICKTVAGDTQIAYAKANGDGWNVDEYNFRRLINYLLILIGKSLNTQAVFGTGRYSGGSASSNNQLNTGTLDKKGMFYGNNNNGAVKVFHLENWWGNIWKITNGCIQNAGKMLYKMCEGLHDGSTVEEYNTNGTGYLDSGVVNSGTITEQYICKMTVVPGIGLVPNNNSGGSSSTFYCDGWWSNSTVVGFARFGCYPAHGLLVGAFAFTVVHAVSYSSWYFGVSLSYKPL